MSTADDHEQYYPLENRIRHTASHRFHSVRVTALKKVDDAKFSRFHVKLCFVAGVGFFADAYDLFAISIVSDMLGYVYGQPNPNPTTGTPVLSDGEMLGVKVAAQVGALIGQLLLGSFADIVGRRRMYGFQLVLIIFATLTQAITGGGPAVNIIGTIIFWRVIGGIAIGGDYPLSAIITSEFANTASRGRLMVSVFSFQGWGQLAASIVSVVVVFAYKDSLQNPTSNLKAIDQAWRIILGFGCVPGVIALYFRLTIPETPRFTMDIERNIEQASRDIENALSITEIAPSASEGLEPRSQPAEASWADFKMYFGLWKNLKVLLGTSISWFAFDIAFYGLTLNNPVLLDTINFLVPGSNMTPATKRLISDSSLFYNSSAINMTMMALLSPNPPNATTASTEYSRLKNNSIGNLILTVAGLIPGFWVSFLLIDKWGRKPIQLMGFTVLAVLFISMGSAYKTFHNNSTLIMTMEQQSLQKALVFLYCLANFFQNFGANTTTFIIPAEVFPTRYRSTAYGISAASGKLGAVIAEVFFARFVSKPTPNSVGNILLIYSFFMVTGIFSTLLLPETKSKSLEELSNDGGNEEASEDGS